MTYETITLETDARGVARLTLNLPDRHNALAPQMIADLSAAAEAIDADRAIRVVVLTGAGESFCAGGDLGWMREQMDATREQRMVEARKLAVMLRALNELPQPLIGRINGQAYGGGIGMMSICDTTVAAEDAMFGLTEARLGLIPATISPYVLARMGEGMARRVFMSARRFGVAEAITLGLVARSASAASLDEVVEEEVRPYLNCSPEAVARSKQLARALGPEISDEVIDMTIARLADTWETEDAREGVSAFFERRKPAWTVAKG
ncbi:crotonase/enoyl-CoA hydratase family protein [Rhodobacteraceae bacterium NNCM2]|nr:crotonase/enoyl-CoA hydratase family protein [Coraliihabitans acroporae]